mmetsp:Transcript_6926/g.10902  ORF Transcript_6926/g.10902 Transcript_6926/m.10902 type:complete len:462 (-) Transcript_6926:347-1732(-)|eukprot:CAMPEP_0184650772 /NCGR_PEP_ID=MMETSP0308-20130426/8335_1 /TAXON_ID=38269 /ORGANISM="Gloeochaete witrockiana, Strain SAG 46.84" /LENGTH=461 /DNA_ID=CAMNT_0027084545 /DNA_START=30 /DNA_END=1415 /DNA_ORIENTATION=-
MKSPPTHPGSYSYTPHYSFNGSSPNHVADIRNSSGVIGPGQYELPVSLGAGKKYTVGSKLSNQSWFNDTFERSPGPVYEPKIIENSPAFSVPGAEREHGLTQFAEATREQPGPGAYETVKELGSRHGGPLYSFGPRRPSRFSPRSRPATAPIPGPASYDPRIGGELGKIGKHYTFGGGGGPGGLEQYATEGPGPQMTGGNGYKIGKGGPCYTFGGGTKPSRPKTAVVAAPGVGVPGPGSYDTNEDANLIRDKAGVKFGTSIQRPYLIVTDSPGPAAYGLSSSISSKGARIGTGPRSKLHAWATEAVPGPGAYRPRANFGMGVPRANFGTSERHRAKAQYIGPRLVQDALGHDSPGPATYTADDTIRLGTGKTFGRSTRILGEVSPERVPGPGAYTPNKSLSRTTAFGPVRREKAPKEKFSRGQFVSDMLSNDLLGRDSPGPAYVSAVDNKGLALLRRQTVS